MDYEKAYKKALEKAKEYWETDNDNTLDIKAKGTMEYLFPELAEGEDEKIRKELIKVFSNRKKYLIDQSFGDITVSEALAWLEKQASNADNANKEYWRGYREGKQAILDKYAELEKQGEQKPAMVEPKFKVGDIIRLKDGDDLEWTVKEVLNNGYYIIVCADRDDFIQLDDKWELVGQKSAWSEEDEEYLDSVICALRSFIRNGGDAAKEYVEEEIDWLNKLKKRIGG